MSSPAARVWRELSQGTAATSPEHEDPRLRGRTYPVPFERVWRAALALSSGGLQGWRLLEADDRQGMIKAEATRALTRQVDDVLVRIYLDRDAQTRVDARSAARTGRLDLGANARRLSRFFRALDQRLGRPRGG